MVLHHLLFHDQFDPALGDIRIVLGREMTIRNYYLLVGRRFLVYLESLLETILDIDHFLLGFILLLVSIRKFQLLVVIIEALEQILVNGRGLFIL